MGTHWADPAAPELNGKPFTKTFLHGSWDGQLIFYEPMITRDSDAREYRIELGGFVHRHR